MKKFVVLLLVAVMAFAAFGCAAPAAPAASAAPEATQEPAAPAESTEPEAPAEPAEPAAEPVALNIGMVTDVGNIDDKSFNEFTWKGCKDWADTNGAVANYYRPSEDSDEARIETIKTAIEKGANVIVCPGYLFAAAYQQLPAEYPEVMFLGVDMNASSDVPSPTANTALITYQEEQSGYLAGYAAVKDGYTKLAFLGGMAVPAVIRYGEGFVQGANEAAKELGNVSDVNITYWYSGSFAPTDDIKTKTAGWYTEGTQIVFSCGGGILLSAIASADETTDGKLIGVDVDQANVSERIITSAKKELEQSVMVALDALTANNAVWPETYAGKETVLGAADDCVGLPTEEASWKFGKFTAAEYEALYQKIKSGEIVVSNDIENHPAVEIAVDYQND